MEADIFRKAQMAKLRSEWTCATKMGIKACSETSNRTVETCKRSLSMYKAGIASRAKRMGMYVN